jgi:lambda family phage minor tail protein L
MAQQKVYAEAFSFTPSALIDLWKVDGTPIGLETIFYFCNGSNTNFQPVTYNGVNHVPFPILVEGMESDGKGVLTRPRITLSNVNGFVSALLLEHNQLVGAIVTRTRVFARFLDASNFPTPTPNWVTPDTSAFYEPEVFYVNRKLTENPQIVSFELASVLDVQNVKLPRRQILANTCQWKYRDTNSCNYTGAPAADSANKTFTTGYGYTLAAGTPTLYDASATYNQGDYVFIYSSLPQFASIPIYYVCTTNSTTGVNPVGNPGRWIPDSCSKTMAGCKLRFTTGVLRTSAFPGVSRAPFISRA